MRFGTWNVSSVYRSGSPTTPARELARYKLNLVGVQDIGWYKGGGGGAGKSRRLYFFLCERN